MGFVVNDPQDITQSCLVVVLAPRIGDCVLGLIQPYVQPMGGSCLNTLILWGCIFARKSDFPAKMKLSDFTVVRWVHSQNFLQLAITATFH